MSQYLIIKKNGVTLGEWSRSTEIYEAFNGAPYEKEEEFDPEKQFHYAIENLEDQITLDEEQKDIYERMLQGNLTYEERFDTLSQVKEIENNIKLCERYLCDIYFMQNCWECDRWEENPPKWTWEIC